MSDSILTSTKKILGIDEDYVAFDLDIITHINSAFFTLTQIGVGPVDGFMIEDAEAVWSDFLGENTGVASVKTYVFLKVKMVFDAPTTSYLVSAMQEQIREMEWRLEVATSPANLIVPDEDVIVDILIDGGTP